VLTPGGLIELAGACPAAGGVSGCRVFCPPDRTSEKSGMWIRFGRSGGPVLVGGRALAGHDKTVLMVPSPGDGCEFWVMMK